jgi:hypothetical protein
MVGRSGHKVTLVTRRGASTTRKDMLYGYRPVVKLCPQQPTIVQNHDVLSKKSVTSCSNLIQLTQTGGDSNRDNCIIHLRVVLTGDGHMIITELVRKVNWLTEAVCKSGHNFMGMSRNDLL